MRKKHTYGNASQVRDHFADGGKVKKNKMAPPKKGGKPKKIEAKNPPGGPHTPGAKGTYPKKMADGGKVSKKKKTKKPDPKMLGSGMAASAGRNLRDTTKNRMKAAGVD